MEKKKILITGGTGFLGQSLAAHLQNEGYYVVITGRNEPTGNYIGDEFFAWDAKSDSVHAELEGAHAVVNLIGKTVDCKKTPDNCDLILRSRVDSTQGLGDAMRVATNPPKIWIQMSTAHIYGDPPEVVCVEDSPTGYGLAPTVGKAWEEAFAKAKPDDVRGVRLRTSFVIGKKGGALKTLKKMASLGLGGKAGHGKQGMSWIHERDFNRFVQDAIENSAREGFYIVSSPNPESNKSFMKKLRRAVKMPLALPSPKFLIEFGAKFIMNTDPELVLYGRYVIPKKMLDEGFEFQYPDLESALKDLV